MANNRFTGATNSNWGTATNWSLGAVPTVSDGNIAYFDNTSPNCTINVAAVCNGLNFNGGTGYTGTITMTNGIVVSGSITTSAGMSISNSANRIVMNATGTLTTNGLAWNCGFACSGTFTCTLADNFTCNSSIDLCLSGTTTYAGAFTITHTGTVSSTFTVSGVATSSTTTFTNTGNVNITGFGGRFVMKEWIINCGTSTFTCTGGIQIGDATNSTKLTYTSGNISLGSASSLQIGGTATLDTYPIIWNTILMTNQDNQATKTFTLNSKLISKNDIILGGIGQTASSLNLVFAGNFGFECGQLIYITVNSIRTITFQSGVIYRVKNNFNVLSFNPATNNIFNASTAGSKAKFLIDKDCVSSVVGVTITDIDNIGPDKIPVFNRPLITATTTNSAGWDIIPLGQKYFNMRSIRMD